MSYVHLHALLLNSVELPHYRHQLTVKVRKQCTLEIMSVKCYCEKKSTREKATAQTKAQATTAINLWFCSLLACLDLWCDKSHNIPNIPEIF